MNTKIIIPEIEDLQATKAPSSTPARLAYDSCRVLDAGLHPGALRGGRVSREGPDRRPRLRRRGEGLLLAPHEAEGRHHIPRLLPLSEALRGGEQEELRPEDRARLHGQPEHEGGDGGRDEAPHRLRQKPGSEGQDTVRPPALRTEEPEPRGRLREERRPRLGQGDLASARRRRPRRPHLTAKEYDPGGYSCVSVSRETREIVVLHTHDHVAKKRYRSKSAERLFQTLNDEADSLGLSRRHLSYLTLELGRAEASIAAGTQSYRQKVIE